jgi:zinc transport system substrate-binding protein
MHRMRRHWIVAAVFASCTVGTTPAAATVPVVATIFPLADIVRQIGGEDVEVVTLLPAGASPHTFEPTPSQIRDVARARVFVRVGGGLDNWAAKLLDAHGGHVTVVTLTDGQKLLGNSDGRGGEARGLDPHVWLDPVLVRDHAVGVIVDALSQAAPERRAEFEARGAQFRDALTQLDAEIRATLSPLPHKSYVAFHSAWRYFGRRYGLDEVAVVEPFPGKEPSAQEIAAVVQKARAAHARMVLIEPQFNPQIAEQVAHEFGGRTVVVDPLGGPDVPGRNHYIDLMRYNLQTFAEALQ